MFQTIRNAWKIPELRSKILFTVLIILIFRFGAFIPVPFLSLDALKNFQNAALGANDNILGYLNVFSGGAFANATLFAMSISPYINAQIIMQLLTVGIPALERMMKEGEEGRKKIARISRYVTVFLGLLQGFGYYTILRAYSVVTPDNFFTASVIILSFSAGTAFIMWLGEQINENGIGNGISIILFAGIVARIPSFFNYAYQNLSTGALSWISLTVILLISLAIVVFIVYMTNAERRIPVQYAKRVVGRKMYGGQSTHIPVKVNMSGVMPIIFASSFTIIPATIAGFLPDGNWFKTFVNNYFSYNTWPYAVIYFILIIAFSFFYMSIQFNPTEVSNNIKNNGGMILGIRPGKPTADFIAKVTSKVTFIGSLFLGVIAVMPIIVGAIFGVRNMALGGTTVLIVVGVALDTVRQLESQMLMRHYKGFLE